MSVKSALGKLASEQKACHLHSFCHIQGWNCHCCQAELCFNDSYDTSDAGVLILDEVSRWSEPSSCPSVLSSDWSTIVIMCKYCTTVDTCKYMHMYKHTPSVHHTPMHSCSIVNLDRMEYLCICLWLHLPVVADCMICLHHLITFVLLSCAARLLHGLRGGAFSMCIFWNCSDTLSHTTFKICCMMRWSKRQSCLPWTQTSSEMTPGAC